MIAYRRKRNDPTLAFQKQLRIWLVEHFTTLGRFQFHKQVYLPEVFPENHDVCPPPRLPSGFPATDGP